MEVIAMLVIQTWRRSGSKVRLNSRLTSRNGRRGLSPRLPRSALRDAQRCGGMAPGHDIQHFENLGLYEMVRRRCRLIVISDAGRDPAYSFEDLGNAVRKIAIDLGVPIRFHRLEKLKRRPIDGSDILEHCDYHAIADIDYQEADGEGVQNGLILYVKAGYHGTESAGVRSYAMANIDFPHQSTANQWFTESQFESYRSLGFEIMEDLLYRASKDEQYAAQPNLQNLLGSLRNATVASTGNAERAPPRQARPLRPERETQPT